MQLWTKRRRKQADLVPDTAEDIPAQWIPGRSTEAHAWIESWSADSVRRLLADADAAGWRSHVIDSDVHESLRGRDERIDSCLVDTEPEINDLLNQLDTELDRRGGSSLVRRPSDPSILLVVGASTVFSRDRRMLMIARVGRLHRMHLVVDREAIPLLMTMPHGPAFRDNVLGVRDADRVGRRGLSAGTDL